jgi:hypothetical protein
MTPIRAGLGCVGNQGCAEDDVILHALASRNPKLLLVLLGLCDANRHQPWYSGVKYTVLTMLAVFVEDYPQASVRKLLALATDTADEEADLMKRVFGVLGTPSLSEDESDADRSHALTQAPALKLEECGSASSTTHSAKAPATPCAPLPEMDHSYTDTACCAPYDPVKTPTPHASPISLAATC